MCVCAFISPSFLFIMPLGKKQQKKTYWSSFICFFLHQSFYNRGAEKKLLHWSSFYAPQLVCFQSLCRQTEAEPAAWTPCSFNWNHDRRFDFIIPVANPWNRQLIANPLGIKQDRRIFFFFYTQREGKILKINKTSQRG